MTTPLSEETAEVPAVPGIVKPKPPDRFSNSIMAGAISGSVLAGALLVAQIWWWTDPRILTTAKMNITFMTLTSCAVVGIMYAFVKYVGRWVVREVLVAIETQAIMFRSQLYDFQHELADARAVAQEHRGRVDEFMRRRHGRSPLPPRQGRRRRGSGYAQGFVDGAIDRQQHPQLKMIKGKGDASGNGDHRPNGPWR